MHLDNVQLQCMKVQVVVYIRVHSGRKRILFDTSRLESALSTGSYLYERTLNKPGLYLYERHMQCMHFIRRPILPLISRRAPASICAVSKHGPASPTEYQDKSLQLVTFAFSLLTTTL